MIRWQIFRKIRLSQIREKQPFRANFWIRFLDFNILVRKHNHGRKRKFNFCNNLYKTNPIKNHAHTQFVDV